MIRRIIVLPLLLIVLSACQPYLDAQDKRDLAAIQQAFLNLDSRSSYSIESRISISDSGELYVMGMRQPIIGVTTVSAYGRGRNINSGFPDFDLVIKMNTVTQMDTIGNFGGDIRVDAISVGGTNYMRVLDPGGLAGDGFTDSWTVGGYNSAVGGSFRVTDFANMLSGQAMTLNPLNEQTVRSLERVNSVVVNGTVAQGYRMTINFREYINAIGIERLIDPSSTSDFTELGLDVNNFLDRVFNSAQMTTTVWIGPDGLIHAMEEAFSFTIEFSAEGVSVTLDEEQITRTVFRNFDQPMTISAPQ